MSVYLNYWWIFTPLILEPLFQALWMNYIQIKYLNNNQWTLLEINVLKDVEAGPKTAEEFIMALHGIADTAIDTIFDTYFRGAVENYFSLEIVSLEGEVHFYVRTPTFLRDMVEAQIYAQYPDAEITQAEDYAAKVPGDVPNEYDLWGCEWVLEKEDAYPIRTYTDYEDVLASPKATSRMIDPMSNIVETMGKMGKGEQMWLQILIRPTQKEWQKDGLRMVAKLIGKKAPKAAKNILDDLRGEILDFGRYLSEAPFKVPEPRTKADEERSEEGKSMMLYLSPGEKRVVEAIEKNIIKPGFETKIRWLYLGKKEFFNKAKGVLSGFGMFAQFRSKDLNYFHVDGNTKTSAYYLFTEQRKNLRKRILLGKYKRRLFRETGFVLNSEELATLYHYPTISVKAPGLPSAKPRPAAPPPQLPLLGS